MKQYTAECELLAVAIKELTIVQHRRITKYFAENKSYRAIAEEENVTVSKIEKSIYRGLEKLKKYFKANMYLHA